MSTRTTLPPTTVVLIHGLWMTPRAWEHWVERYEAWGCTVLTPGYPGIGQGEAGLHALRNNPDIVAGIGAREVMDYLTEYIGRLDARPVIMTLATQAGFEALTHWWQPTRSRPATCGYARVGPGASGTVPVVVFSADRTEPLRPAY